MSHIMFSAAHKSSGKTTISIGVCAALNKRQLRVQPFKKGPDYIDPLWLGRAADRNCINLDFYTMQRSEIITRFHEHMNNADIGVIEGNKGLYDGLDLDGSNSNAALAKLLGANVILILDARGMTRGIAPLVLGYQSFDPDINITGVILNQVGGSRHEGKLVSILEHYTDVKLLGAVHRNPDLVIDERHLGLVPSNETDAAQGKIDYIRRAIEDQVDLDTLVEHAGKSVALPSEKEIIQAGSRVGTGERNAKAIRIGIARDEAFGFYYPDDLKALEHEGATLIPFSPLHDDHLPQVDAMFIGGGFPETHMHTLSSNTSMRNEIHAAIENGMPVYAECGGLMYLANTISWHDKKLPMVGALPVDVIMCERPQGRGYVRLHETPDHPWPDQPEQSDDLPAHEFHYSRLENIEPSIKFAYKVLRGTGIDGQHDGLLYKNVMANYTHLRNVESNPWARRFVTYINSTINPS